MRYILCRISIKKTLTFCCCREKYSFVVFDTTHQYWRGVTCVSMKRVNMGCGSTYLVFLSLVLYLCNGLRLPHPARTIQKYQACPNSGTMRNGKLEGRDDGDVNKSKAPTVTHKVASQMGTVYRHRTNIKTKHHLLYKRFAEDRHTDVSFSSSQPPVKVQGSARLLNGFCPGTCRCDQIKGRVECNSGLWRRIPKLPANCSSLSMKGGHITALTAHSFSFYLNLTHLSLRQVNMRMIRFEAFEGLPSLQILSLKDNRLNALPNFVFNDTPFLENLFLSRNAFHELPHDSICDAKRLVFLNVQGNQLTRLSFPPCYLHLYQLMHLEFSDNPISEIHKQDFVNLRHSPIRTLILSRCRLKRLKEDVFTYLQGLTEINLSRNSLQAFPKDTFKPLTSLSSLQVAYNDLRIFVPVWIIDNLKVANLNIGYNHITSFNPSDTQSLNSVTDLFLDNNRLVNLSSRIFTILGLYSVQTLTLQRCSLRHIESHTFQNLTHLKFLSLSQNPLTAAALHQALMGLSFTSLKKLHLKGLNLKDINDTTFIHLAGNIVTEFMLDHSDIDRMPSNLFSGFTDLRTLSLKRNKIIEISDNTFLPLTKLTSLWISDNNLLYCVNPLLSGLASTLVDLDESRNRIKRFSSECTDGLDHLRNIELTNNILGKRGLLRNTFTGRNIKSIQLDKNRLTSLANNIFNNLSSIVKIWLRDNALNNVEVGCFQGLTSLSTLRLSNNPQLGPHIDNLQIALSNVPNLLILDLSSCGIERLPVTLLRSLAKLQRLVLTNNAISSWEPEFFLNQMNLAFLYLRRNKIVTINSTAVQYLPSLREIYLDSNPFSCSCNIRDLRDWILNGRFYVDIDVYNKKSYACASPNKVKGVPLLDVDLGFRVCGSIDEIIGGSVGGFVLVVVTVSSVVMYRYRWYIRYGCFLVKGRLRRRRNQERHLQCTYDAFVSYNHGDQKWVIEHLLPELEYRGNIRLCLHDRDWLAGPDIADNIVDSIENSHKTILVLSNHFAQSQWCELELSMAQHKLLTSHKDVLVLVLKDPIDDCYMTSRLRHLMTTQTYLAWEEGDPEKERRFWRALRHVVKGREGV